jgi:hypothetical protein
MFAKRNAALHAAIHQCKALYDPHEHAGFYYSIKRSAKFEYFTKHLVM